MERAELKAWLEPIERVERGGAVFLVDRAWSAAQREQAERQIAAAETVDSSAGWLMVPSGGTSGAVKFARHDERTLGAAVEGFSRHFGLARVNAVGVLPRTHVSGLMAWLRCRATGGDYCEWEWKRLEAGETPALRADGEWVISLVPTQLQRLIGNVRTVEWLRSFRAVCVGGGPLWAELADAAAAARLPLSPGYGMTETAAMVTALRPEEFLAGARSSGTALPHARVGIDAEGRITVWGASLFRGYFPELAVRGEFATEDLGRMDARGHLHVLGRRDAVIITGGKKVQPVEVEAALRASGEFDDVAVVGLADAEWGEIVVACYPAAARRPDLARAVERLAAWQRPKRFVALAEWPRSEQGKVNRAALRAAVR